MCRSEEQVTIYGSFIWEETPANQSLSVECSLGPAEGVGPGFATRECNATGSWLPSNLSQCLTVVSFQLQALRDEIANVSL